MRTWKKILIFVISLLAVLTLAFVAWGSSPTPAMPEVFTALESDSEVAIVSGENLTFQPVNTAAVIGVILYPGGRVDYRAYAPFARALAENGYLVVIPKMPLNLAVFGIDKASEVMDNYPQVEKWVIGGHSLGGSMAANFVVKHPGMIDGILFLASYPASSDDLSAYTGVVTSISGTRDGLATPEKIDASIPILPLSTTWVRIAGGNHAYFGWYGEQAGDNRAEITREEQQEIIIQSTLDLLKKVEN